MKSLNRTLALVLVLVMVFGLFGVASASSSTFTDAASVGAAYAEAVDVLTGIGVVNGATATTLDPTGNYTREQAAKVVAYIALGKTTADALACSAAPFSDVAADRWSAGYIQYAVSQGIINGLGDGSFNPTGSLTGYQFAKMLLCALGYGKSGEYTGTGWEIAVAKDALGLKIFKGDTTAATNAVISRQQAMLMAFNAMFLGTVKATYAYDNGVKYVASYSDPGTSFAELIYGYDSDNEVSDAADPALVEAFTTINGVYGHYWYYKSTSVPVTGFYSDETVIGTSTNGKSIETLTYDSNANAYFIAAVGTGTEYYVDGDYVGVGSTGLGNAESYNGLGVKVVLVDTDDDTDTAEKVFVTTYYVGVLSAAPVVKASTVNGKNYVYVKFADGDASDIGVSSVTGSGAVLASAVTGYAGLVKGDVVLVTYMDNDTYTITKAASFTGAATASSSSSLTIGGTSYKFAEYCDESIYDYNEGFLNSVKFYTDSTGYLVYAAAVTATSTDYLYVLANDSYAAADAFNGAANQSYVVLAGGTAATITVDSLDGYAFADYGDEIMPSENGIYAYVKNTDGTYALITPSYTDSTALATDVADGEGAITKGATSLTDDGDTIAKANAATVFVVRNIKTAASTAYDTVYYSTWTVYTGYASVPTMADASYSVVSGTDGYADVVFVDYYTTEVSTDTSVIYLLSSTPTAVYKTGGIVDYYTFPAIVDGVKTVVKSTSADTGVYNSSSNPDGLAYAFPSPYTAASAPLYDGVLCAVTYVNGKLTPGTVVVLAGSTQVALANATQTNFVYGTSITAPVSGVIEIGGVGYNYTSTTVVFYISEDMSTVTMDVAANLSDMDTDVIISAVTMAAGVDDPTSTQQNTLKAIFVQAGSVS